MDRISELPQDILHRILCFLSTKQCVRTSVLSKSWRHLWSTRPKIVLHEIQFGKGGGQQFLCLLDKILQGYHDRNLCVDEFHVEMWMINDTPLLQKWIPILIQSMRVKEFHLHCGHAFYDMFVDVPSPVFRSEHLRNLNLGRWNLNKLDSIDNLHLKNLQTLFLYDVRISDRAFDNLISSCPLVEHLDMQTCTELRNISMINKARNLKVFYFDCGECDEWKGRTSIEIDPLTIEKISILDCLNWPHRQIHFGHLKYLELRDAQLSTESFHSFSSDFPCLESLILSGCYGFKRIQLSSASIKFLNLWGMTKESKMIAIDAPNIVEFRYHAHIPRFFSFTTTSGEWSSVISFDIYEDNAWLIKLKEVLKVLSRSNSKIYLYIQGNDPQGISACSLHKPVILESLGLNVYKPSSSSLPKFINGLFCISRPRKICNCFFYANVDISCNHLTEFMCKTLLTKGEDREMSGWKRHLEEAILEAYTEVGWRRVHATSWLDPRAALLHNKCGMGKQHHHRIRLKWREK